MRVSVCKSVKRMLCWESGGLLQLLFPVMGVCCLDNLFFYYFVQPSWVFLSVNCCEIVILSPRDDSGLTGPFRTSNNLTKCWVWGLFLLVWFCLFGLGFEVVFFFFGVHNRCVPLSR